MKADTNNARWGCIIIAMQTDHHNILRSLKAILTFDPVIVSLA